MDPITGGASCPDDEVTQEEPQIPSAAQPTPTEAEPIIGEFPVIPLAIGVAAVGLVAVLL